MERSIPDLISVLNELYSTDRPNKTPQSPIPIKMISNNDFFTKNKDEIRYARLGHSSVLIQIDGKIWLNRK